MKVLFRPFNGHTDWEYISDNAGVIACEDTCGITAVDADTGEILAGVVFDSFTNSSALAHIVVTHTLVLKYGFLQAVSAHAYQSLDREVLYGLVPASNERALRFDKHIGFKEVVRLPDGYDIGIDYVLLSMHKATCRWLTSMVDT